MPSEATDIKSPGYPESSLLSLQHRKVERPYEGDCVDVIMTMEVLHAQVSPVFVQAVAALGAYCQLALKPHIAPGGSNYFTLSARQCVCRVQVLCLESPRRGRNLAVLSALAVFLLQFSVFPD